MELRTNVENVPREFGLSVGMDLSKEFGHIICQCGICRRESLVWLSQFFYLDQHSVQSARILKTKPCVHTAGAPRVPSNAWLVSSVQWMLEKWQVKVRDLRIAGRGTMVASETHTHRLDSFFFSQKHLPRPGSKFFKCHLAQGRGSNGAKGCRWCRLN